MTPKKKDAFIIYDMNDKGIQWTNGFDFGIIQPYADHTPENN